MKILIIDDEQFFASNLCTFLQQDSGIRCEYAVSGEQARMMTNQSKYDLIICDLRLGSENGRDLMEEISQLCPGQPFVVISAYESFRVDQTQTGLNVIDFFEKPFDLNVFRSRIMEKAQ